MNTTVSFEISKVLKEKGFDEVTEKYWAKINQSDKDFVLNKDFMMHKWNSLNKSIWSAPTIADVVMWLYLNNYTWISVDAVGEKHFRFIVRRYNAQNKIWEIRNTKELFITFNSPTEAYSEAILYTLKNLL